MLQRLSVLTDEIMDDFEGALGWLVDQRISYAELRMIDGKNIAELTDAEVDRVKELLNRYGIKVSGVASPVFKCKLSEDRESASGDTFGNPEESVEKHFAKLNRVMAIAKQLDTINIRIFSFWREAEPAKYTDEIVMHLREAAKAAEEQGVMLLLENEPSCNGGRASEIADYVKQVASPALTALWDPGNEAYIGQEAFPKGYSEVKELLTHVHIKDAYIMHDGQSRCVPAGSGDASLLEQIKALEKDGYKGLYTIETHFTPEGGSRRLGTEMSLAALRAMVQEVQS